LSILDRIDDLVTQSPVEETRSRFGNPAFRTFYDSLSKVHCFRNSTNGQELVRLHQPFGGLPAQAVEEVSEYLKQSFGDRERIDYGSGHELNFICWL